MTRRRRGALRLPPRFLAVVVLCALALGSGLAGAAIDRMMRRAAAPALAFPDTSFHPIESILRSPTDADRQAIRRELTRQLNLTSAQADSIDSIMTRRSGEFRALRAELRPRVQGLVDSVHTSIEQILSPAQRDLFRRLQPSRDTSRTP
ncbi:MAG TPA: hypothetical protein VFT41_11110 [Gemmatimonadaceae bacterium]|nr:hypothetical protein [Gemmatimonadaceae bacterium]